MQRGPRLVLGVVGVAVMFLTAGLLLRLAGNGDTRVRVAGRPSSIESLGGDPGEAPADPGVGPGEPPTQIEPLDPALGEPPAVAPAAVVATVPLPGSVTGPTTAVARPGTVTTGAGPAFDDKGVWVVKADGTSPTLVARGASAGVASGGTWVAFVEDGAVKAVKRSDLRTRRDLAPSVAGTAAQGLPIAGGKRGVAFLQGGNVVLVDPAVPGQPLVSYEARAAEAVASEQDGEGRLVWSDADGLHVGDPSSVAPAERAETGMLVMGHGVLAHLQDGQVTIRDGPRLGWGAVDRMRTGPAGLVAAGGGRVRLRTTAGEDRILAEGASMPVISATRVLYVSSGRYLSSASLTGTGATVVAVAGPGRTITNLDLLDDATLVVTVA